jgi:hypothetical protein
MRVPYIGVPQVLPGGGATALHVETPGGYQQLQQGVAALGQGVDQVQAGIEKEQHEAAVVEARDNLTQYQHETTDTLHGAANPTPADAADAAFAGREAETGFLSTKGKAAAEQSADTLDELEQKRLKRAEGIQNKKARELFLMSSAEAYENTRRTVESHVSQQIEQAKVDSISAATDEAVRAAALDPGNDKLAQERISAVAGAIGGLGRGQDFNDAQTLQVQQKVAATRLDALLNAGNVEGAERVLDANKWALGGQLDDYRKKVETAKAGAEAEQYVTAIVNGARLPDGQVDEARALRLLEKSDPKFRAKAEPILNQHIVRERQAWEAETKRVSTAAFSFYNARGWADFVKTPLATELNQRDPALYNRLQNDAQSELDRLDRKRRGTAEDRRAQTQVDAVALNQFLSLTPEERSETDTESWAKGRGMSPVAVSSLGKLKEQAAEVVTRGQATSEGEFVKRAVADAESTFETGTTPQAKARRRAQIQEHEAKARRWFSEWVSEHKGHAPTDAEAADQSGKFALGRVPIGDEGAAAAADVIVRRGTQKVRVLPELDFSGGGASPPAMIRVRNRKTGATGSMPAAKFNPEAYERLDGS